MTEALEEKPQTMVDFQVARELVPNSLKREHRVQASFSRCRGQTWERETR